MAQNVSTDSGRKPGDDDGFPAIGRRYTPIRCLGEGAQGVVHLAEDRLLGGRLVAVKTLRPQTGIEWRTAFRHEFEVLAGLSHPRLSAVHDFGTTRDGRIYFTRDYISGDDLKTATVGIGARELLGVFVEVVRALKPLHNRGLLHGDLKPGNAILSPDGVAHLIDFSFVRGSGEDAMRRGTVQYMAPEVIEGKTADVRADLYALGASFFDIAAGAPPFEGSVSEVVNGHLGEERPELDLARVKGGKTAAKKLTDGFKRIIGRLLARDPDARFPNISEVEAALTALAPDQVAPDPLPDHPVISESEGQEKELSRIRDAVATRLRDDSSGSSLFVIEGELGTGKSSCLRGVKWWAQLGGDVVVETRCGGGLLAPIADLIDQILTQTEGNDAALAAGRHLAEQLSSPGAAETDLNGLMRESMRLLADLARTRPVVVAVDDLEQASPETLRILRGFVAASDPGAGLVFLTACETSFPWRDELGSAECIALPLLGEEQIAPLVESFLGQADPSVVERILLHTGGNPLFVTTLLRDLAASGECAERLERLGAPRQLEVYWRDRLETLGTAERRIVDAAAVLQRSAAPGELARVAGLDEDEPESLVAGLENEGWLRRSPSGWYVATPPLGQEVIEAIDAGPLSDYHRRAILDEPDAARQLFHAARCGDLELVRGKGREVIRSLERLGALHAARDLLVAMEDALPEDAERAAIRLDLGRICLAEGDFDVAHGYLVPLAEHEDAQLRRRALMLLGRLHSRRGELEQAAERLQGALAIAGEPADDSRALQELANVESKRGNLEDCARTATDGLDRAPAGHSVRADLLGVLAKAASLDGRHEDALAYAQQAADQARQAGDRRSLALAIEMLAWVRQRSGDLGGAVEELERAVALNREFGDYPRLMRDQRVLGDLKWWREDWGAALAHYEEAMRLARAVANPAQRLMVSEGLAGALAKVGRFERARLLLGEAEHEARERGFEELRLQMLVCRADLTAAQGRIEEGMPFYGEALDGFEALGRQAYVADLELEMAGWRLWRADPGDVASAAVLIKSAEGRKRETKGRGFAERLALHRGELSVAEGRFEEGISRLEELTARAGEAGMKDLAWQAHVAAARGHLAHGADFLARRQLRQAEALLDQLSAGFPGEHQTAFWQDVRRNEVRRLLEAVVAESGFSSSLLVQQSVGELDQEAHALYRVLEFNKQLSAEHDLDRLLEAILDAAIELTGAERGLVLMAQAGATGGGLEVRAAREIGDDGEGDPHERFSRSIAESVHLDGEPVVTVDAMGDERFNEFISIHELKLKSVACLPVRCRGQALGVLYLENRLTRGRFGGRDLRVLAAFADQVAIAISQATLLEEARRRQAELEEARQAIQADFDRQSEDLSARKTDLKLTRERLERVRRQLAGEGDYHGVVGNGPLMSQVFSLIERVKDLDVPVVFVGQSGTGKDLLARVLHDHGSRKNGSFVALNCGSVPETLVESTLFGHVKGAFSGAAADRQGILEAANEGTLYLDEIGDMSPRMQVDLLRVLQEGTYTPLGAAQSVAVDLRLVASSKLPLPELASAGRLRRDLLYRLEVVTVDIPPLAERRDDILPLARRILDRESTHTGRPSRPLSRAAAAALVAHPWPGNVRELEQAIRRALVIGEGVGPMEPDDIFVGAQQPLVAASQAGRAGRRPEDEGDEKTRILAALERCRWNRTKAAKELGIPRRTFYRKLDKLGLVKAKQPS